MRVFLAVLLLSGIFSAAFSDAISNNSKPLNLSANQMENILSEKRDPYVAGVFSLFYSGAGQFYNGEFTKGSLFFMGETLVYAYNLAVLFKFTTTYSNSTVSFNALTDLDKGLIIGSFVFYIGIKIFSIYDAYTSAETINRQVDASLDRLSLYYDGEQWKIQCSASF